jgi:S1-C subfamily serine protease
MKRKSNLIRPLRLLSAFLFTCFAIGCSTAGTSLRSSSPLFAPRTYSQNYSEVFDLAAKIAHQTFAGGHVYPDFRSGVITVDNPSFWAGDTRVKIIVTQNRDDSTTVNVTSKGYGFNTPLWNKSYGEVKSYLQAFDQATEEYFEKKARVTDVAESGIKSQQDDSSVIVPSIYDDFLAAVVVIRSSASLGSGFFLTKSGYLVTNHHVIGNDHRVSVKLRNGRVLLADVLAFDAKRDIALLSVKGNDFPCLQLGNLKDAAPGKEVLAIGIPEGLSWSVSKGIISAIRQYGDIHVIQTDTPINSGNSGGPLFEIESGVVVGINTFGFRKDLAEGLNFAIAADELKNSFAHYLEE